MYHLTPTSPILLGLLALLAGHIQAQNATDTDSPVIDVLYITDETFGLSDFAGVDLVGSIAEANPTATVIAVECGPANFDPDVCGTEPFTITYGPRTLVASEDISNVGVTIDCSIAESTASAVCTAVLKAPAEIFENPAIEASAISSLLTATDVVLSSTTFTGTVSSSYINHIEVTVTAGQSLLASASANAQADSATTSNGSATNSNGATSHGVALRLVLLAAGTLSVLSIFI